MRELFEQVLDFQLEHSSQNTPAMSVRGVIIRNTIPEKLRGWEKMLREAVVPFNGLLEVEGRDGTGRKTLVPWVRIYSPELSPSAQTGWYIVYLFRPDGAGVALCLMHGSTRFDGRDFQPRPLAEAARLMEWARGLIGTEAEAIGMEAGVTLGSMGRLSRAYESTTAFSKTYSKNAVPDELSLARDVGQAVMLLGKLYRAQQLGRAPDTPPPEVEEALTTAQQVARPGTSARRAGQGFGLNAAERAVVEKHAMELAVAWLAANGFVSVQDVHRTHSCDFLAVRAGIEHVIEVKGTTSALGQIILTANEVALHRASPANMLIVVYDIDLEDSGRAAAGGRLHVVSPFQVENFTLRPLSYICEIVP